MVHATGREWVVQMRVEVRSIDLSAVSDAHNGDDIASDFTTNLRSRAEFMKTFSPEFSSGARRKFFCTCNVAHNIFCVRNTIFRFINSQKYFSRALLHTLRLHASMPPD